MKSKSNGWILSDTYINERNRNLMFLIPFEQKLPPPLRKPKALHGKHSFEDGRDRLIFS